MKYTELLSLAQLEAARRQVAAPVGEDLVLARELVRVAEGRIALLRAHALLCTGSGLARAQAQALA